MHCVPCVLRMEISAGGAELYAVNNPVHRIPSQGSNLNIMLTAQPFKFYPFPDSKCNVSKGAGRLLVCR